MNKSIIVEGHRGYCAKYPENTLISFEAALDLGVDAIEFDVWLTSDKVPVLMHDGNALRTCGVNVHLRDLTLEEAKKLEPAYESKFGDKYKNIGYQLTPHQKHVGEYNTVLRHHTCVEEWHKQRHTPHQEVEQVFTETGFIWLRSHNNKDMKNSRSLKNKAYICLTIT